MERILVMFCLPMSKAGRRYIYRLAPTMAVYLVFLFVAQWTFHHLHPTGFIVYLLAVLPALPLIGSLAVVGLYIAEETDEFERSIVVQSMIWGLGAALSIGTIWSFLEDYANAPHVSFTFYVYFSFWIVMGIAQPIIRRRYR
jgi:xanthosine utilization system XapX-like protein